MTTNNITTSTVTINNYTTITHTNEQINFIPTKVCNRCFQIKQLTEFYKAKANKDGYQCHCKNCDSNRRKEYYNENKENIYKNNKKYYERNNDKHNEYYIINKDWLLEHSKKYHKLNKVKILHQQNEYSKNKLNNNPIYELIANNRSRIHSFFKSNSKATNSIDLLGCNREFFLSMDNVTTSL